MPFLTSPMAFDGPRTQDHVGFSFSDGDENFMCQSLSQNLIIFSNFDIIFGVMTLRNSQLENCSPIP